MRVTQIFLCLIFACVCLLRGAGQQRAGNLVARKDLQSNPSWRCQPVHGRDFWLVLKANQGTHPFYKAPDSYRSVLELPFLRECALSYINYGDQLAPEPVQLADLFGKNGWNALNSGLRAETPFLLRYCQSRPPFKLKESYQHNKEEYLEWKKQHPTFLWFEQAEWDNELVMIEYYLSKLKDESLREEIRKRFPSPPTRQAMLEMAQQVHRNVGNFFFEDPGHVAYMRAGWCLDHMAAAWGCKALVLETTNTTSEDERYYYRWQVSLAFTRGASRQHKTPWYWYMANFYNGYDSTGQWKNNYFHNYFENKGIFGPEKGMSAPLYRRAYHLAWLAGAQFIEPEEWICLFLQMSKERGEMWLSEFGRDFQAFYEFYQAHPERGISYAPIAFLVPFNQGYANWGGQSWSRYSYEPGDQMIDGFMYTIVPPFEQRLSHMSKGVEGALFNSPYGDIFDVLAPDAPDQSTFRDCLQHYKVAILMGDYPENQAMAASLQDYVSNGGTLLLSSRHINRFLDAGFIGAEISKEIVTSGRKLEKPGQQGSIELEYPYQCRKMTLRQAKPILRDENGLVLASMKDHGDGRVIFCSAENMMPYCPEQNQESLAQAVRNPLMHYFIGAFCSDVLPLKVEGDIQYGMNILPDGILLYLINNRGVLKFVDTPHQIDPQQQARVEITLNEYAPAEVIDLYQKRNIPVNGKAFSVVVPAGEISLLKIRLAGELK